MAEAEQARKRKKRKGSKKDKKNKNKEKDENRDQNGNGNAKSGNGNANGRRSHKQLAPNKTLFLQNLPRDAAQEELQRLFIGFPGFCGVNLIENKPGIGFAEFDDCYNSANAQRSLNGFSIRGHDIAVEFAQ